MCIGHRHFCINVSRRTGLNLKSILPRSVIYNEEKTRRFVSSSTIPSSIEIIYQRSSSISVENLRIGKGRWNRRSTVVTIWLVTARSHHITDVRVFDRIFAFSIDHMLSQSGRAQTNRMQCKTRRNELRKKNVQRLCEMNLPFRHLMFGYYVVSGLHVCIAPADIRTDRQTESVICDAVSLLCCCRDGSVGFCYGYDCVLPQTKIKSARGFTILTQNKNFACVCFAVRTWPKWWWWRPMMLSVATRLRWTFLQSQFFFLGDHSVGCDA